MTTTAINSQKTIDRVPSPPLNYDYSVITSGTDPAATLLLDAKNEYNKQLISHLRQPVFNLMKTIYNTSEDICHQENTPENVLMVFQDNLAQVPKWSKTRRTKEYDEFLKISKCDWFNELIKFCYITHVKILTIVNKPRPDVKLSISIPSGSAFYHSVCVSVARELWRLPFLFNKNVGGKYEYQKNMRQIEQIIDNSVDSCIRTHIPMKTILQEYLDNDITTPNSGTIPNTEPTTNTTPGAETFEPTPKAKTSSRLNKPNKLEISNELDEFLDTPNTNNTENNIPSSRMQQELSSTNKKEDTVDLGDGLETVSFSKSDEIVDELEIIEPNIDDDNPATPISMINEDSELATLKEANLVEQKEQLTTKEKGTKLIQLDTEKDNYTPVNSNTQTDMNKDTNKDTNKDMNKDTNKDTNESTVNNDNKIDEFDIDSLPEINLSDITNLAAPNKPTTPEPPIEKATEIKYIPLSDMNEPGQAIHQVSSNQQELLQPIPKKKIIVEELGIDGLDEVPLEAKVEELKTFKNQNSTSNIKNTNGQSGVPIAQEFAFF